MARRTFAHRLEHGPLRALVNTALDVSEVTAEVGVLLLWVGTDGAGAPESATAFEEPGTVDAHLKW